MKSINNVRAGGGCLQQFIERSLMRVDVKIDPDDDGKQQFTHKHTRTRPPRVMKANGSA